MNRREMLTALAAVIPVGAVATIEPPQAKPFRGLAEPRYLEIVFDGLVVGETRTKIMDGNSIAVTRILPAPARGRLARELR